MKPCKEVQDKIEIVDTLQFYSGYTTKPKENWEFFKGKSEGLKNGAGMQLKVDIEIMKKLIKQIPFPNKEEQDKMGIKIEKSLRGEK